MKRELFFILLCVIGYFLWQYTQNKCEGFADTGSIPINIPKPNPQPAPIVEGDPQPFSSPSTTLLSPPPGQTASVNSYPASDPAEKKTDLKRIKNTLETLNGFLTNEGPGLEKLGDPAVQLPLQTARSDTQRLSDEIEVLDRNPGIESTLSNRNMNQIEANLRYLQKKWRLSANSLSGGVEGFSSKGGVVEQFFNYTSKLLDGFQTGSTTRGDLCYDDETCYSTPNGYSDVDARPCSEHVVPCTETTESSGSSGSSESNAGSNSGSNAGLPTTNLTANSSPITLDQLNNLQTNINATIIRLSASGATSPLLRQRINVLESILQTVNDYLAQIRNGQLDSFKIPITQSDYNNFLPFIGIDGSDIDQPLPTLIRESGVNSALANLFPFYFGGDVSGAKLSQELFQQYVPDFFKNMTFDLNINLTNKSDPANAIAEQIAKNYTNSFFPSNSSNTLNSSNTDTDHTDHTVTNSYSNSVVPSNSSVTVTGEGTTDSLDKQAQILTSPSRFVWKDRANQICDQISKRGLNPYDYGCLENSDDVSENFSYRGYARMICTRLGTNYDPSIPEMCGCPPQTWAGWK